MIPKEQHERAKKLIKSARPKQTPWFDAGDNLQVDANKLMEDLQRIEEKQQEKANAPKAQKASTSPKAIDDGTAQQLHKLVEDTYILGVSVEKIKKALETISKKQLAAALQDAKAEAEAARNRVAELQKNVDELNKE